MKGALNSLNSSKSPGPDQIHPRILKELSVEISYPLVKLFHKTLAEGKIPHEWKLAEVRPIFKKGVRSSPNNYRPVSLTCIICKVFESFIRNALFEHIVTSNLLADCQFGFCPGRSCVTQLLTTLDEWFKFLDNKIPVDAAYMDFRKAFDSVPHKRLILKLEIYGVGGNILKWVEDFLTDREQYVSVEGQNSTKMKVSSGVPQGSVLGPTLFIYYINDLPDVISTMKKLFADDAKASTQLDNEEYQINLQNTINNMDL